jgi:hypothetical protein
VQQFVDEVERGVRVLGGVLSQQVAQRVICTPADGVEWRGIGTQNLYRLVEVPRRSPEPVWCIARFTSNMVNRRAHLDGEIEHADVVDACFATTERAVARELAVGVYRLCVIAQILLELGQCLA